MYQLFTNHLLNIISVCIEIAKKKYNSKNTKKKKKGLKKKHYNIRMKKIYIL